MFPDSYIEKRKNPRYLSDDMFLKQVSSEIACRKIHLLNKFDRLRLEQYELLKFWYDKT